MTSAVVAVLMLGLVAAGCSGGSSSGDSGGTSAALCGTSGSRYWHEGDDCSNAYKTNDAQEASLAQQVVDLVNLERLNRGLPGLTVDAQAERAAKVHSEDMLARGYFGHQTPENWSPGDRLQMTGAGGYSGWGENIAFGYTTAQEVMDGWMNSTGHRDNILNPSYTHIGVGVANTSPVHWTQVFLTR